MTKGRISLFGCTYIHAFRFPCFSTSCARRLFCSRPNIFLKKKKNHPQKTIEEGSAVISKMCQHKKCPLVLLILGRRVVFTETFDFLPLPLLSSSLDA